MAVPKHKVSKRRIRMRQAANRWHAPEVGKCLQCGAVVYSHTACGKCGFYQGRQVLQVKVAE
jgi:large subunit ribosomal protein L32